MVCVGLTLDDLDPDAIHRFRQAIVAKTGNQRLLAAPDEQLLRDVEAIVEEGVTNAALILSCVFDYVDDLWQRINRRNDKDSLQTEHSLDGVSRGQLDSQLDQVSYADLGKLLGELAMEQRIHSRGEKKGDSVVPRTTAGGEVKRDFIF